MKAMLVSSSDTQGGAAKAAFRIHQGLIDQNVDSSILVQQKYTHYPEILGPDDNLERFAGKLNPRIQKTLLNLRGGTHTPIFSSAEFSLFPVAKKISEIGPDVINLHWISDGMIRLESLARLNAPIIWTMHDMWPFTGGCHYDNECGRYVDQCGNCPQLSKQSDQDLSFKVHKRKEQIFKGLDLTVISPSRWLAECASNSSLFKERDIRVIPNGLDLSIFKPADKTCARNIWNLPLDRKIVLLGAMSATSDRRKGFELLVDALKQLKQFDQEELLLVIFGDDNASFDFELGFESRFVGTLLDEVSLAVLYSAADVMVVSSRQDNLPNTAVESISCGTPVVGFDIGGLCDIVKHHQCGYLAKPFDASELAHGINWVLSKPARHDVLSDNARKRAVGNFDIEIASTRYKELFRSICER